MLVLDASVTLAWALPDENDEYADAVQDAVRTQRGALVPSLWSLEVANILLMEERCKRITHNAIVDFVTLLQKAPIEIDSSTPGLAFEEISALARQTNLTTYDAAYLELAKRTGLPLATLDQPLAKAAKRCGVEIFVP